MKDINGGIVMKNLFILYPKCTTCKKAKDWLDVHEIEYEERNIQENNPTEDELKEWVTKSGYPVKKFFNTSGTVYKELNLKEKLAEMPKEEQISLLATNGMLVKRPIFVSDDTILVGFKEGEWTTLLINQK